jgi:hypothetical protein
MYHFEKSTSKSDFEYAQHCKRYDYFKSFLNNYGFDAASKPDKGSKRIVAI